MVRTTTNQRSVAGRGTLCAIAVLALVLPLAAASPAVDRAVNQWWRATTPAEASTAAAAIVKAGAGFDETLSLLRRGRPYVSDVPRGVLRLSHVIVGTTFPYMLDVPLSYDPAKRYQVRIQLHGGVGRPEVVQRTNGIGPLGGAEQIYILPGAWSEAEWWTNLQVENLRWIVDSVKRTYNVDENRVVMSGVSDGGTGTYYFSMRDTTPFAAFLPLNGAAAVLRGSSAFVQGEMFPNNFVNKPFFIVNGGLDPLYPTSLVEPYIQQMQRSGVTVTYLPQPNAVHNTAWWPEVKDTYEAFVHQHPRQPIPETLTWESDLTGGTNRAHWLVIDTLAQPRAGSAPLADLNDMVGTESESNFGIRNNGTRVTAVTPGSNAAAFGLLPGDVIAKIDARAIPSGLDVLDLLALIDPGTPVSLTVSRDGALQVLRGAYTPVSAPRVTSMFLHNRPSGRVDLVRRGNEITATTRGVGSFTLLLSPEVFDFAKPLTVTADGQRVFEGRVTKSIETLLTWAARDNDRTMLFGAELKVTLTP